MAGLTEVDPTATMALLWDKVPQDKRLDAAGKRILERILTGAFRPLSRLWKAQRSDTPICQCCDSGEEETKEHLFWRCPAWANVRESFLNKLREIGFKLTDEAR